MNIIRFIYEKGVAIRRSVDGRWYFQAVRNQQSRMPVVPSEIGTTYGIRPILITDRVSFGKEINWLLPNTEGRDLLDSEHSQITPYDGIDVPALYDIFNLNYVVGAVVYHCKRLAEVYSEICYDYAQFPFPEDSDNVNFGHQSTAYYEFDALITAARRTYDTTRYLLWKAFGPSRGSLPSPFVRTLSHCPALPLPLADRLQTSWSQFGVKLTDYRDCIQHYVPIDFGAAYAQMGRLPGGVWSTSLLIPDNPKAQSKSRFQYTSRLDALTYGWNLTNEILDVVTAILNAVLK